MPIFEDVPSILDPRGPAAAVIAQVWWLLLGLSVFFFFLTFGFLFAATVRSKRRGLNTRPLVSDGAFISIWGIAVPSLVFILLMGVTIGTGARVYEPQDEPGLTIEVTGHQFWWEVRYPAEDGQPEVITANEVHIPVGVPVALELLSADVVHNFWVPQLHGKMYMIPGRTNTFWIQADEPGVYRGICGEYCGVQHAKMQKLVIAQEPEEFEAWRATQAQDAVAPEDPQVAAGAEVFIGAGCIGCHAVGGLGEPDEVLGPDLTHLASRETLAAGVLQNNRGMLGGWILDPQSLKPGARMPPANVTGEELQALLDYLESLE